MFQVDDYLESEDDSLQVCVPLIWPATLLALSKVPETGVRQCEASKCQGGGGRRRTSIAIHTTMKHDVVCEVVCLMRT
jgi:hypothetical protein